MTDIRSFRYLSDSPSSPHRNGYTKDGEIIKIKPIGYFQTNLPSVSLNFGFEHKAAWCDECKTYHDFTFEDDIDSALFYHKMFVKMRNNQSSES